jgi:isoaspartyl peptidase/L-asparaginase-like protein (Ntn-hydrolase superfamily)
VVAHGAGNVVSNTVALIMTLAQVRNSLRLKTIMETVVVMNLVSNRKSTVLVGIVDIVDSAGEISFVNIDGY